MRMMRIRTFLLVSAIVLAMSSGAATAQSTAKKIAAPDVPDAIKVPASETAVLMSRAAGWQIYTCRAGTDGNFTWTFTGPEAELYDRDGKVLGRHTAGPVWLLNDGSEVRGKMVAQADSPDPNAIPWLRLDAFSQTGKFEKVTHIQRVRTEGGKAPTEACDASKSEVQRKVIYKAEYYFFAPSAPAKK